MPSFRFQFTDARGQILEGTLQASSSAEAEAILRQRGYPNVSMLNAPTQAPAPQRPTAAPAQQMSVVAPPVVMQAPAPRARVSTSDHRPTGAKVRTKKGTDKQRFFLFAQFSKLLNAGINPAKAFEEVARVTHYPHFRDSFDELARESTHGRPLSSTMERYPDLYPEHVVGMIRAGEAGGFIPEAFMELSDHAEEAYKFKRYHWFVWYLFPRAILAIPLVFAAMDGLILAYKRTDTQQSASYIACVWEKIVWPYGPMMLGIAATMLLLRWWLGTYRMRHFRHRLGLKSPIYGPRARNESVSIFTWTLSRLARAGVPPQTSWQLAVSAVPNLEMQERLRAAGAKMHSGSKLSEVVFGSRIFPEEFAPVLTTGEMVGDVTGALDQLERASRTEYMETTKKAKFGSFHLGITFAIITSGIIVITVVYGWYNRFYNTVLDDYKWSQE